MQDLIDLIAQALVDRGDQPVDQGLQRIAIASAGSAAIPRQHRFGVRWAMGNFDQAGGVLLRVQRHYAHSLPGILATMRSEVVSSSICSHGRNQAIAL